MAAKVSKLDEQFRLDAPREKQKDGSCSNIFRGVSIYVNGYTGNTVLLSVCPFLSQVRRKKQLLVHCFGLCLFVSRAER